MQTNKHNKAVKLPSNKAVQPQETKAEITPQKPLQEWFFPADGTYPAQTIKAPSLEEATELYTQQRSANMI